MNSEESDCSGHGTLNKVTGLCDCDKGWYKKDCSQQYCPGNCYGNGLCKDGECQCYTDWTSSNCSVRAPKRCLPCVNGSCDPATGECQCLTGWKGDTCSTEDIRKKCPDQCDANGTCNQKTGDCICSLGWSGASCDILQNYSVKGDQQGAPPAVIITLSALFIFLAAWLLYLIFKRRPAAGQ